MKIGVFDSGIGGLTVVKSLLEHQLFEEIIYFGDTARVPYGIKDKNTIIRYALEAVDFFKNFELDLIIVACNTVSAYALNEMKESSTCPVIGVVEAGVLATNNALEDKNSNILILGTKATINPLVEEEIYDGEILEATFKHYFSDLTAPDAIILGCTHFPLISSALKKYFYENTILIHSGDAIVEYLKNNFNFHTKYKQTKLKFFASENPDALKNIASKWLDKNLYV